MQTIPCSFSRAYFPRTRTTFVIRDARGLAWEVVYLPNPDKAGKPAYLSAGWSAFARANHLRTGDYCAFEVLNPAELFVTIFKSVQVFLTTFLFFMSFIVVTYCYYYSCVSVYYDLFSDTVVAISRGIHQEGRKHSLAM